MFQYNNEHMTHVKKALFSIVLADTNALLHEPQIKLTHICMHDIFN